MNSIVVRKMAPAERPQVQRLFETVYSESFSDSVPAFADATAGEEIYIALLDGRIAGMASVWEPDAFIHYLLVEQAARHKKVGSTLISALAGIYAQPLTLKCLVENTDGMAFYRATGWQALETGLSEEGAYALLRYEP